MPDRDPPDPDSPEAATKAVRMSQRLVSDAREETARAQARVQELGVEVSRLSLALAAKEAHIRDFHMALDREKGLKEEAEEALRQTSVELADVREVAAALGRSSDRDTQAARGSSPRAGPEIGTCERILGALDSIQSICRSIRAEKQLVCVHCYTFDLEEVMNSLIYVVGQGVDAYVLADERKTYELDHPAQLRTLRRGHREGVQVRIAQGFPLQEVYLRARPGSLQNKFGGSHAKVVIAQGSRVAFVGSTNYTTSSLANAELTTEISLTEDGLRRISQWFSDRWAQGVDLDSRPGAAQVSSRARSQGAPRRPWSSVSPSPSWSRHAHAPGPSSAGPEEQ